MFDIDFVQDSTRDIRDGVLSRYAYITLGAFTEEFVVPLDYWSEDKYRRSWANAITQAILGPSSCLITSLSDPDNANFIVWWLLYKEHDLVFVQNQLLFLNTIDGGFDPWNPYSHIPPRDVQSEEGVMVSEWIITVNEIIFFMDKARLWVDV